MRKFAFVLFLLLFIAAVCFPAFSKARRGYDSARNRYYVVTPSKKHWLGGKSTRALRGLSRMYERRSEEPSKEPPADPGDGKSEDPVVSK